MTILRAIWKIGSAIVSSVVSGVVIALSFYFSLYWLVTGGGQMLLKYLPGVTA